MFLQDTLSTDRPRACARGDRRARGPARMGGPSPRKPHHDMTPGAAAPTRDMVARTRLALRDAQVRGRVSLTSLPAASGESR